MIKRFILAVVFCLISVVPVAAARMPRIWLAPADNVPRPPAGAVVSADFPELFAPDATWPEQLPQIRVVKVYGYFASNASDAELIQMFAFLRAHHIELALEHGVLSDNPRCGVGVEGYHGEDLAPIAQRFRRLGGTIADLAMDEPLFYGNVYSGRSACHASLRSLAADAAHNIAAMRAVMPDLQVGEVEVANPWPSPQIWSSQMAHWADLLHAATGNRLAFLHLDVLWSSPWMPYVASDSQSMGKMGIPVGVIFDGGPEDRSDAAWARSARAHYTAMLQAGYVPDDAVFQTWMAYPSRALPVSDPNSMTGIAHGYVMALKRQAAQE